MSNNTNWGKVGGIGSCINAVIAAISLIMQSATDNNLKVYKALFYFSFICLIICLILVIIVVIKKTQKELPPINTTVQKHYDSFDVDGKIIDNRFVVLTIRTNCYSVYDFEVQVMQNPSNESQKFLGLPYIIDKDTIKTEIRHDDSTIVNIDWNCDDNDTAIKKSFSVSFAWNRTQSTQKPVKHRSYSDSISFRVVDGLLSF